MDAESLARLKRNLAAATDDALVALANRGLVRRAAKDLQATEFQVEIASDAVLVRAADWTVRMPAEGPAEASDDTPATGVTRQILAATIFLRDHWQDAGADDQSKDAAPSEDVSNEAVSAEAKQDEIAAHSLQAHQTAAQILVDAESKDLMKWAGKSPVLEASAAMETVGAARISYDPHLSVEFSETNVRVFLLTDRPETSLRRLLDQFKTTASRTEHARWVLMAVLSLKQAAGKSISTDANEAMDLTEAIRDDRLRVARRVGVLLSSVAASGIAHPSTRIVERLRTASVAAEAARFPRVARLLNSIADDALLQIARDAGADPARMRQRMVVAHALSEAAARKENAERSHLFGRARTNYVPSGDLELAGLGAYGWRTASGFEGLTAIFWDVGGSRFLTASVSRGEGQDLMFSIPYAYHCGIGWSGGSSVEAMCRCRLRLKDAKTNPAGRLSVSESCRVEVGDQTDPQGLDFGHAAVRHWSQLATIAQQAQPIGLRIPDPRSSMVVVQPEHWGDRWFDELTQAFVWQIHDETGDVVEVRVPWTEVDETGVMFLESLKVERDHPIGIFGRLEVQDGGMFVYPFSVFSSGTFKKDKILCPQFDQDRLRTRNDALLHRLRKKYKRGPIVETRIGDDGSDELPQWTGEELADASPLLRGVVLEIDEILNSALESGSRRLSASSAEALSGSRDRLAALGLNPLADSLSPLLHEETYSPGKLLSAAYRLNLLRESLRLSRLSL